MSRIFSAMYGSKKFIVHCGNIGQHATRALQLLGANECTIHEKGQLMQTIEKFTESDKRYLLVASAEYGLDAPWCDCQFILKVPFASKDDHMKALEVKMGKTAFRKWYTMDALTRLVQQAGRIGRGYDSFGATFILDGKFREVYRQYQGAFPGWFKERLLGDI
jgi:Rad3-related DNA helicase